MSTDKLKDLVKTNVHTYMQQKFRQNMDLLKSNFSKAVINQKIQSIKNSEIITKAKNTLEPTKVNVTFNKIYEDVVKAPITKTQNWMQKKKDQILDAPLPNLGPIPLGPSPNNTIHDGIDTVRDRFSRIVGDKDGEERVTKGKDKTSVGKTGEGIPLEEVKPNVLQQIHPDDNGAYGYLPNEGSAYYKPEYDFTNIEWTKEMQNIRKEYLEASKQLERDIQKMTAEGFSKEEIAEHVVEARNQQKIASRKGMTAEERSALEERNIKIYGNPVGPTADSMFNNLKDDYIDKNIYESDVQIWEIIIQKSMKKDDVINTLLGLKY